jgi:hypothetical protein
VLETLDVSTVRETCLAQNPFMLSQQLVGAVTHISEHTCVAVDDEIS